ncbi:MAG: hypothetical protein BWK80_25960 [Desulfobacteraceae bacterium IS3]|nr:MAG: hypothetical protein BWK80_25960 [Desulfobacteraceae bacterium IS3]
MSIFSSEFGDELLTPNGLVSTDALLEGKKLIGLFFAAHWAPPCRQFTPVLKEFYETVKDSGFEIIFISSDRNEEDLMSYYHESHGEWLIMPFPKIPIIKEKYGVRGIPSLIILSAADLKLITKDGRSKVSELEPTVAFNNFLSSI